MSAADLVKAAKAKGIKLDVSYVYSVRGAKKKRAKATRLATKAPVATNGSSSAGHSGGGGAGNGLVAEIERIVEAKVTELLKSRLGALFG